MVSHWSLDDSKSPQISRILLSILANLNNAVVWMVSTWPLISKSSSPCTNPLVTEPSALTTISITVTFIFYNFFKTLARSTYLSFFLFSFNFTRIVSQVSKVHNSVNSLFLLIITRSGHLTEISWSFIIYLQIMVVIKHYLKSYEWDPWSLLNKDNFFKIYKRE